MTNNYHFSVLFFCAYHMYDTHKRRAMKNLIVECGISGAALARMLAESGEQLTVIDSKDHIAGNIYDYYQDGICVHKYGTHIFHTSNKAVWDFVSRFCQRYPYQHQVRGQIVPIPFNLNTFYLGVAQERRQRFVQGDLMWH